MTSDLKTLKDLDYVNLTALKNGCVVVRVSDLKQEAIKWVKHIRPNESKINNIELLKRDIICDWIISFFNITEEDLKDDVLE